MESIREVFQRAVQLDPADRIQLVEAILETLDKPDPFIEAAWLAESEARYEAYKRGDLPATEWEEIRKRFVR